MSDAAAPDDLTLVTGGGGLLGGAVVRRLRAADAPVRVLSRRPLPELEALGAEVFLGDLEDRQSVLAACHGVRGVVHAGARPGIDAPLRQFLGPNVAGTRHVIDGCLVRRVRTLVHVSSPSVAFDGTPHEGADERLPLPVRGLASYPHSKLLAERDALRADRTRGLRTIAVRPHLIWGPGDRHVLPALVAAAKAGRIPAISGADPLIAPTFVENAAAAIVHVLTALPNRPEGAGRAYFLNDLPPVRLHAFVRRVAEEAGLEPPALRRLPSPVATAAGRAATLTWRALRRPGEPPLTAFAVAQLRVAHWYRIDGLRAFGEWETVESEEAWRRTRPFLRRLAGEKCDARGEGG
ncbi:NAD-dependent epimerase/dehydratase family protein [Alienimonas californiensis]|uniref:3 beta-hydroxysteroid dehydrogenase/Delta 5-->4-isomerase n=1 Tax=Alienimonas californiensis TaxID=2527989 RepID=A0A517PDQ1_9PLAN|nr:NAD-dependent epimerase/dehydratase family protein [Alienimonas californiensis]QDT17496.1 3 beta-hydroxysteroid dehydrogenase/Delta 5-->4-isomerase [Alienimonas californiensis]